MVLNIISWNINGKKDLLSTKYVQNFLNTFDIVFLTETHATQRKSIKSNIFDVYEYPDLNCNIEHPRGGSCMLIKKLLQKYIFSVIKVKTDWIQIDLANGDQLHSIYIPPSDSPYFDQLTIPTLGTLFVECDRKKTPLIVMGDINSRFGQLSDIIHTEKYEVNPDKGKNANANEIIENVIKTSSCLPINHLVKGQCCFGGGMTFVRGTSKSQLDWALCNKMSLKKVKSFELIESPPNISDHKPIKISVWLNMEPNMTILLKSCQQLNNRITNHSKIPVLSSTNCNVDLMNRILPTYLRGNDTNLSTNEIATKLQSSVQKCGKIAKKHVTTTPEVPVENPAEQINGNNRPIQELYNEITQIDIDKWNSLKNCNDSRTVWKSINFKGEIKSEIDNNVNTEEIVNFFQNKFTDIDYKEAFFNDLKTDIKDPAQDREINEKDIRDAMEGMNERSKTSDGISPSVATGIITAILPIMLLLYNAIFVGGIGYYPAVWLCIMNAIPKKGKLQIPKCVRGISIMGLFAKIYDKIIMERLYKRISIPKQQSAYQKGKGCNLHVAYIRILKELAKKTKMKIFIIFTDFEAAFDLVSRRTLFQKLISLGVSVTLLNALMAMYSNVQAVVEHNGEFSDSFFLLSGIRQGSPTSGVLYIAYTYDLINLFTAKFNVERFIESVHLLMHADDIIIIATDRNTAEKKVRFLEDYCENNHIRLQPKKCGFIVINEKDASDTQPMNLKQGMIKNKESEVYLGSTITKSTRIVNDIEGDSKNRNINIIKYYGFLRENRNAPLFIKLKVLEACTITTLLYNCETWASANIQPIEVRYRKLLKAILRVKATTCNEIIYLELGCTSIKTQIKIQQYRFWKKLKELKDDEPLRKIIKVARDQKLRIVKHYDELLEKYNNIEEINIEYFDEIKKDINKKAECGKSRYATYKLINPNLEVPYIYNKLKTLNEIELVARLRTGAHKLKIETGRQSRIPRELRTCTCGEVEDETHFLLKCVKYHLERLKYGITQEDSISVILSRANVIGYLKELYLRRSQVTQE